MPESSSISRFRCILPSCFKPSSLSPLETFNSPQIPQNCDVSILNSRSLFVMSVASYLSSHLTELGVSVAFSGETENLSPVCVVILSKDFADSVGRLEELRRIHECKVDLIPIFFDVRPSDVRKVDKGVFRDAFTRVSDAKGFESWRLAFESTALLSGWKFSDFRGNPRKLLKAVVQNVMKKVKSATLQVAKYPVGLAEKTEKLGLLLEAGANSNRAMVLGIVGMGGIGKTTLAKEFFNTIRTHFKAACFLEDVKGRVEKNGLERVQSMLLKDLLQIDHQIHSTNHGKYLLKKCLNRAEVIIVLDNIDDFNHIDALWVPEHVHQNSIILITTRDRKLVECISNSEIYNMEGLERKYARELFCWHAFLMPCPALGFDPLVEHFVNYCDGLPLSLETLGGKLFGEELPSWNETLKNISESLPGDIERQLRVTYDALDLIEKQIFLDIALFFIGEDKEMPIRIWNALGWFGSVGVQSLQQKCLVKVENGHFQMHDQLRQMAEKIVDEEDIKNPGNRRHLWRPNDIMTVLNEKSGSGNVEGIKLTVKQIQNNILGSLIVPRSEIIKNSNCGLESMWSLGSFAPMTGLRLLILEGACVEGDFSLLSEKLIWLRWRHCPSGPLPMGFPLKKLRVLDLSGGKLSSLWSDIHQIPVHLEELNLRGCALLQSFPVSVNFLNKLEKLVLSHCISLVDIPIELCDIYSLKYVDLSGCSGLQSLPDRLGNWKRLQYLDLSKCSKLESLPSSFGGLEKLEHLDLSSCSKLSKLPSSFHKLKEIRYLNMEMCLKLESEKDLTDGFSKLEFLNTSKCKRFDLPSAITFQRCMRTLKISCSQFKVLPHYLGDLENLEELSIWKGFEVKTLDLFTKLNRLKDLTIRRFPFIESLGSSLGHLRQLKSLTISKCSITYLPEEIGYLKGLERLIILDCSHLAKLPMTIKGLSSLTTLSLTYCSNLQLDPGSFPNISTLHKIYLGNCKVTDQFFQFICQGGIALKELELKNMRLPALEGIGSSNIASFSIINCSNISSFQILSGISSLKIEDCSSLKKITVPRHNTNLQTLYLGNCKNLLEVSSIENLKYLKSLNIDGCFNLQTVAGLDKLNGLSELRLFVSDWYLFHKGDDDKDWLKKTLNRAKIPQTTHLSATVELPKFQTNLLSPFQQIPRHSSKEFKFKLPCDTQKSFCGVVICFITRYSLFDCVISVPSQKKDKFYGSTYLQLVNGANVTEICEYKIPDTGSFIHVSFYMDEFLVSEMFADGSELVISSEQEDMVKGVWIYSVRANQKHLAGKLASGLIENLKEHKSSVSDYVPRSELEVKKWKSQITSTIIDMDLCGIHALGIVNFIIERRYSFNQVVIYVEQITHLTWRKHQQLFEGVNKFNYLDLELGNGCRNLVENPVINIFEAHLLVWSPERSKKRTFKAYQFPPQGPEKNQFPLDLITSSHKGGF